MPWPEAKSNQVQRDVPVRNSEAPEEKRCVVDQRPYNHTPSPASQASAAAALSAYSAASKASVAAAERSMGRMAKPPHNYEAILRNADSPLDLSSDKLYDHLSKGVFLKNKKQKYWVDSRSNSNCFMLYARDLSITWSENMNYWTWFPVKETPNDTVVDAVELRNVCWLDITGKFDMGNLTPGTPYEVVFVVKLEDPAYGWDTPVNVKLTLPSTFAGQIPERKVNMREQLRYRWLDIPVGEFVPSPENAGELRFSMYEHDSGTWKKGLFLKGVAIRPKSH